MKLEAVVDTETLEHYRQLTAQQVGVLFLSEHLSAGKVFVC